MGWVKRGLLMEPPTHLEWAHSHAALPIAQVIDGSLVEMLFSSRDDRNRAQIGRAVIDLDTPAAGCMFGPDPIVRIGERGSFDDSGVTSACLVADGDHRFLYYSGWSLDVEVPFLFFIGCAVSDDAGASFRKVSVGPVLGRSRIDPYLTASPSVLIEGGLWRMWYVSGTGWSRDPKPQPNYRICYAESKDGIDWRPTGRVCIDYASDAEHALARPHVIRDADKYRMWYSYRGQRYRIGYAESDDGLAWKRRDEMAGVDVSAEGWDSEMVAYPWVGDVAGKRRMLYNGNAYGFTGVGQAVLE